MPRDITPSRKPKTHLARPETVFDKVNLTSLTVHFNDLRARFDLTDGTKTDFEQPLLVLLDLDEAPAKLIAAWDNLQNQLARHYTVEAIKIEIQEAKGAGRDTKGLERDLSQALNHI